MNTKKVATLASIAALAVAMQPNEGHAVDFKIADGQTETTAQTLGAGDSLTIEKGGKLSTGPSPVVVNGADATITNLGSISFSDGSAYGVHSTASGTTFRNTGSLTATGICSYGVFADEDHFTLINDGKISTTNEKSDGVHVEADYAKLVNNRTIETKGDVSYGINIYTGAHARITNHGSITTAGTESIGIYNYYDYGVTSDNVLINTGTVRTTGADAQAIYANVRGMKVINSGFVSSKQAEAIYMKQADQTLTLLKGSVIEGDIRFDQPTSATLNIGRGLDARLTLNGIPTTIDTNGQPYVIDGNTLAVIATEPANVGATTTASTNAAISNAVGRHLAGRRQGSTGSGFVPLGYAPEPEKPFFPEFAPRYDYGAWTSAYGSFAVPIESDGVRINQGGVLFGVDSRLDDGTVAGVFSGFGYGMARQDNGATVDTTTVLGGGYGTFNFGAGFLETTATMGVTFNKSSRHIVNNGVAGGVETASGDYSGAFFSPTVTVGVDHSYGDMRMTPSVTLLYAGIYQEGYTETGSTANLTLGSQYTNVLTARGEIELGSLRLDDQPDGWSGSVRLGAEGTWLNGNDVDGSVLGSTLTIDGNTSLQGRGFVGADVTFTQGRYEFSAKTEVGYSTNGSLTVDVQSGIRVAF